MQVLKETTAYRQQLKSRIMEAAMKAFIQQGIRAVKMDDIAQSLSISKRTLYELYGDKEQLLFETIKCYDHQHRQHMGQYALDAGHNVIEVILEAYHMKVEQLRMVNPAFYTDILKYPKLADYLKHNNERMREEFLRFMQRGVNEGYLRNDVNYDIVHLMLEAIGLHILHNESLNSYPAEVIFTNYFLVTLRGLCTKEGLKVIEAARL